jgi:hypothetical protein
MSDQPKDDRPKEYRISTLNDCMLIPMEKWGVFLGEFIQMLTSARLTVEQGAGGGFILPVTWIDDGKGKPETRLTVMAKDMEIAEKGPFGQEGIRIPVLCGCRLPDPLACAKDQGGAMPICPCICHTKDTHNA